MVVISITQFECNLASISESTGMGCVCGFHIRYCLNTFWYMGMIPDLAVIRDRARKHGGNTSMEFCRWVGKANNHWRNFEMAYLLLAGLSTPLVLSVHTIVSFDFAVANLPGWHTTIFPPYLWRELFSQGLEWFSHCSFLFVQFMDYMT